MAGGRGQLLKSRPSAPRPSRGDDVSVPQATEYRMRGADERRSKMKEDMRALKGKAPVASVGAPSRKRKALPMQVHSSSEEEHGLPNMEDSEKDLPVDSDDSGTPVEDDDNSDSSDDDDCSPLGIQKGKGTEEEKNPIKLDVLGFPNGRMMPVLVEDVKRYAKDMDPTCSWEAQPSQQKKRFFKRLYTDWEMKGGSKKVSEKWISPIVTKILINTRWRLNGMIDAGKAKPVEVTAEQWDTLVRNRQSPTSRKMSEHMRAISVGKGSKLALLRAIEGDAISSLSIRFGRKPKPEEVSAEVAREYTRQEEAKRASFFDRGKDIEDINMRVADMEGALTGLQHKIDSSHVRFEDMLREIMDNRLLNFRSPCEQVHTLPLQPNSTEAGPSTSGPPIPISSSVDTQCLPHSSAGEVVKNGGAVLESNAQLPNEVEGEGSDREDVVRLYMQDVPIVGNMEEQAISVKAVQPALVGDEIPDEGHDCVVTELSVDKDGLGDDLGNADGERQQQVLPPTVESIALHRRKDDQESNRDSVRHPQRLTKSMQPTAPPKKTIASKPAKGSADKFLGAVKSGVGTAKVGNAKRAEPTRKK